MVPMMQPRVTGHYPAKRRRRKRSHQEDLLVDKEPTGSFVIMSEQNILKQQIEIIDTSSPCESSKNIEINFTFSILGL